jgi:hypothetical protein
MGMQAIADELLEKWREGSHRLVIDQIVARPGPRRGSQAALLGALLAIAMHTDERTVFFRLLTERINKVNK